MSVLTGACLAPAEDGPNVALLDIQLVVRHASSDFVRSTGVPARIVLGADFPRLFGGDSESALRRQCHLAVAWGQAGFVTDAVFAAGDGQRVRVGVQCFRGLLVVVVTPASAQSEPTIVLGKVEARILEAIARGESTNHIAAALFLSRQGVNYHIGMMLRKFRAANRSALISKAAAAGVLEVQSWPPSVPERFVK